MDYRYVADRLATEEQHLQQPSMQISSSSEDVEMETTGGRSDSGSSLGIISTDGDGSIDELSAKFSVQGTSSSKSSGKKKVVSYSILKRSIYIDLS